MSRPNFRSALLELDRELASVRSTGDRDVRALVGSRRRIAWRLPALALAAAVAVLLLVRARDRGPAEVAGFTIDAPASSWHVRGDDVEVVASSLELDVPGFGHVVAQRGARVGRIDGGIRVVQGRVDVAVTHRPPGAAPALVRVSHGTIAVLGTRFTIEQSAHGGHVVLHEGRIRFESGERRVVLDPGSSLTWPLAPVATPSPASPASSASSTSPAASPLEPGKRAATAPARVERDVPAPTAAAPVEDPQAAEPAGEPTTSPPQPSPPALDVDRMLRELANLRAKRRFADAAGLLEQALANDGLPIETVERLSYELGDIRTYQLADRDRACRHWQAHRTRFPQGRYTAEVAAAVRRLGCEEPPP